MNDRNWLEQLKVGDSVIVDGSYRGSSIGKVEKITKTQIVVNGARFQRKSGFLVGCDSWNRKMLRQWNEEDAEEIHRKALVRFIRDKPELIEKLPMTTLRAFVREMKGVSE